MTVPLNPVPAQPDAVIENLTPEQAHALLHKLTLIHNALFSPNSGAGFFQFGMLCEKLSTVAKKPKAAPKQETKEGE